MKFANNGFYQGVNSIECHFDKESFYQFMLQVLNNSTGIDELYLCNFILADLMKNLGFSLSDILEWCFDKYGLKGENL